MNHNYLDIRSRIAEEPTWYDENGAPRYGKFSPDMCPNIYVTVVTLMVIGFQACAQRFTVQMSAGTFETWRLHNPPSHWHYGDPPVHGCVGDMMNCDDLRVLEVWNRELSDDWERRTDLEGEVD